MVDAGWLLAGYDEGEEGREKGTRRPFHLCLHYRKGGDCLLLFCSQGLARQPASPYYTFPYLPIFFGNVNPVGQECGARLKLEHFSNTQLLERASKFISLDIGLTASLVDLQRQHHRIRWRGRRCIYSEDEYFYSRSVSLILCLRDYGL